MAKFQRADIRKIVGENCTEEIENALMALHHSVLDPLLDDLQKAKETADKLPDVQKKLDDLKQSTKDGEDWHQRYTDLVAENTKKSERAAKETAYRNLLKSAGIAEKRLDSVLKVSDLDSITLDEKGGIKDADKLKETLKTEWADFVTTTETHGADTPNPPKGTGKRYKDKKEILDIKDTAERQRAIAENHEMFGF